MPVEGKAVTKTKKCTLTEGYVLVVTPFDEFLTSRTCLSAQVVIFRSNVKWISDPNMALLSGLSLLTSQGVSSCCLFSLLVQHTDIQKLERFIYVCYRSGEYNTLDDISTPEKTDLGELQCKHSRWKRSILVKEAVHEWDDFRR